MKKILTLLLLNSCALVLHAQPVLKSMLKLPDTGVTSGYTATYGEDNDFNLDVPLLTVNANGTVMDSITGLLWQQLDGGEMTIENALVYCDTLTLGGFTDWRLPTAHEAYSIMNLQHANPALDTLVFTKTLAQYWWSSDRQANDSNKVWVTNSGGGIGNHPRTETISAGGAKRFHVRAVRQVYTPQALLAHFNDNGDGTVTDVLTGLIWQQVPYADSLSWEDALVYADTLTCGGIGDWRLPNVKEIQSINLESVHHPSLDTAFFDVQTGKKFWSSTTLRNQPVRAWYLDDQFGITTYDLKTNRHEVLCVRGTPLITHIPTIDRAKPSIYPNPFERFIRLQGLPLDTYCQLFDAKGQCVWQGRFIEQQDFSFLNPGIYLLQPRVACTPAMKIIKSPQVD